MIEKNVADAPFKSHDEWEDHLPKRFPDPQSLAREKETEAYRNYENPARDTIKEFYRLNHRWFGC